jgi:hypothetical protein
MLDRTGVGGSDGSRHQRRFALLHGRAQNFGDECHRGRGQRSSSIRWSARRPLRPRSPTTRSIEARGSAHTRGSIVSTDLAPGRLRSCSARYRTRLALGTLETTLSSRDQRSARPGAVGSMRPQLSPPRPGTSTRLRVACRCRSPRRGRPPRGTRCFPLWRPSCSQDGPPAPLSSARSHGQRVTCRPCGTLRIRPPIAAPGLHRAGDGWLCGGRAGVAARGAGLPRG